MIRRVAFSLRVSTEEQADGHSLTTQERVLRKWAEDEGWQVVRVYEDAGKSAYRKVEGRDAFLQMIEDAESGLFDAVLILKLDRWMRGVGKSAAFRERLETAGVRLRSYEERAAFDGTLGGFVQGSMADLMAEYYSLDLSKKVTANLLTRAEEGLTLGDVPFGYVRDDPKQPIYPDPVEAEAVRGIFERYATGLVSLAELAEELNVQGFEPRSKRGKTRFSADTVGGMIKNPVYAGYVTRRGEILRDGLHEAIVSRELFDRVQGAISKRAKRPRAYARRPPHSYLLAGVGICAKCGGPLWANSGGGGKYRYYRCAAGRSGERCDDGGRSARVEGPDSVLGRMFEMMHLPPDWQERIRELSSAAPHADSLAEQRRHWKKRIQRAKEGFKTELLDAMEATAMKREAEVHLQELEPEPASRSLEAGPVLTDMCQAWPLLTAEERRDAVRITLKAVRINVRTGEITEMLPMASFEPLFRAVAETEGGVVESRRVCDYPARARSGSP